MRKRLFVYCIFFIILGLYVNATGIPYVPNPDTDYLIAGWDQLPFKNQRGNSNWSSEINEHYQPVNQWTTEFPNEGDDISFKCLSYAASTTNDWFNFQYGLPMQTYRSFINGKYENGTNPRYLEAIYHQRAEGYTITYTYAIPPVPIKQDPVTREPVPYSLLGYSYILNDPPEDWINYQDPNLGSPQEYLYTSKEDFFNTKGNKVVIRSLFEHDAEIEFINALNRYGPLISFTEWAAEGLNIHSMTIIGYGFNGTNYYFIAHDNYGKNNDYGEYSKYKKLYIQNIDHAYALLPKPDWSTFHHDLRRTGFTLLKGDLKPNETRESFIILRGNVSTNAYSKVSIGDSDNNNRQDIIVTSYIPGANGNASTGEVYALEENWQNNNKLSKKWSHSYTIDKGINAPAMLADTAGNSDLEILFGYKSGGVVALDEDGDEKWRIQLSPTENPVDHFYHTGSVSHVVAYDLDKDGKKEIAFAEYFSTLLPVMPAQLWVIDDNGNSYTYRNRTIIGNGGVNGAISVADIDNDNYPELVVPTFYGLKVYNFTNEKLYPEWSTNAGVIQGAPVLFDVNRNNKYEIIYVTTTDDCASGYNCTNNIRIIDPTNQGSNLYTYNYNSDGYSITTPAIGDLDGDGDVSLILTIRNSPLSNQTDGKIVAYRINRNNNQISKEWTYPSSGSLQVSQISPSIADIDGDNEYEVIYAENNNHNVYIISPTGSLENSYSFQGNIGSAPAIGDVDNDKMAEIAVIRSGSPYLVLSVLGSDNSPPVFINQNIPPITALAGESININESGLIHIYDPNGNPIILTYSGKFNQTGYWQTNESDIGHYNIQIEASDGNLSSFIYVDVFVLNHSSILQNKFSDNTTNQSFTFSGAQNFTKYIRIPKQAIIQYVGLKYQGSPVNGAKVKGGSR